MAATAGCDGCPHRVQWLAAGRFPGWPYAGDESQDDREWQDVENATERDVEREPPRQQCCDPRPGEAGRDCHHEQFAEDGGEDGAAGPAERAQGSDLGAPRPHGREGAVGEEEAADDEHEREQGEVFAVERVDVADGGALLRPALAEQQLRAAKLARGEGDVDRVGRGAGGDVHLEARLGVDLLGDGADAEPAERVGAGHALDPDPDLRDRGVLLARRDAGEAATREQNLEAPQVREQQRRLLLVVADVLRGQQRPTVQQLAAARIRWLQARRVVRLERNPRQRREAAQPIRIEHTHHSQDGHVELLVGASDRPEVALRVGDIAELDVAVVGRLREVAGLGCNTFPLIQPGSRSVFHRERLERPVREPPVADGVSSPVRVDYLKLREFESVSVLKALGVEPLRIERAPADRDAAQAGQPAVRRDVSMAGRPRLVRKRVLDRPERVAALPGGDIAATASSGADHARYIRRRRDDQPLDLSPQLLVDERARGGQDRDLAKQTLQARPRQAREVAAGDHGPSQADQLRLRRWIDRRNVERKLEREVDDRRQRRSAGGCRRSSARAKCSARRAHLSVLELTGAEGSADERAAHVISSHTSSAFPVSGSRVAMKLSGPTIMRRCVA